MPRQVRIEYPGAVYHVMSRGNRQQDIYLDDVDREDFLKTLAEACQKTAWQVHAYCLMTNHYHSVVETPNANLVVGMAWLQSAYMRLEVAQAKADRVIGEELHRLHWQEAELASRRKRDPAKLAIAVRLRKDTTLSVKETAARLHLGTPGSASVSLLAAINAIHKTPPGSLAQARLEL